AVVYQEHGEKRYLNQVLEVVRKSCQQVPFFLLTDRVELSEAIKLAKKGVHDIILNEDRTSLKSRIVSGIKDMKIVQVVNVEKQASEYDDLLQTIINAIPAPIFYKNEKGVYLGCNHAFLEYLGLPREKIIGKTVYDVAPRELADIYFQADRDLLAARGTQFYEAKVAFADGTIHDVMFHKAVFDKKDGNVGGQVGVMLDITERKQLEIELEKLASSDSLTGAANRRSYVEQSESELQRARRTRKPVSVLYIDVDHFKSINDEFGHGAGDEVLITLVSEIRKILRDHDILARTGGEEFAITLPETSQLEAKQVASRILNVVRALRIKVAKKEIKFTVSIGFTECDPDSESFEDAMYRADEALYDAKNAGRNTIMEYTKKNPR
ncbi:MAG: diguanylate cyclase, partial [Gammaproteobacteria bacterium]|nr:diguanylate cyclase [Gammaproteobacteria bacterium]